MRCLRAEKHQGDVCFGENAGMQCTAIALIALLLGQLVPIEQWSNSSVNNVLFTGNGVYSQVIRSRYGGNRVYLLPSDLPSDIYFQGLTHSVQVTIDLYSGVVGQEGVFSALSLSFQRALRLAFQQSSSLILTLGDLSVAVFQQAHSNSFYVFDSHSRDDWGLVAENGGAVLLEFEDFDEMLEYFHALYASVPFNISPVNVDTNFNTCSTNMACKEIPLNHESNSNVNLNPSVKRKRTRPAPQKPTLPDQSCSSNMSPVNVDTNFNTCSTNIACKENPLNHESNSNVNLNPSLKKKRRRPAPQISTLPEQSCSSNTGKQINDTEINNNTENSFSSFVYVSSSHSSRTGKKDGESVGGMTVSLDHSYASDQEKQNITKLSSAQLSSCTSPDFCKALSVMPNNVCECCQCIFFPKEVKICSIINHATLQLRLTETSVVCKKCFSSLGSNKIPNVAFSYNCLDVGEIPNELKQLYVIEKRLISLIPMFLTLMVLPGGQYGQTGIALHVPVDIESQLSLLPQQKRVFVLNCERPGKDPVVVPVRYVELSKALYWLKENNPLYAEVNVSNILPCKSNVSGKNNQYDVGQEFGLIDKNISVPLCNESRNSNSVFLPAPASRPVNIKDIENGEEKVFPWLFPYGKNGIGLTRKYPLSDLKYFQARLYNKSPAWRCDIPYLMSALNRFEWAKLTSCVSIYMRTHIPSERTNSFHLTSAHDLDTRSINPTLSKHSYMFTQTIRGTAAYWKCVLLKLLAMVKTLGPPTYFLTLSANDNWPETKDFLKLYHTENVSVAGEPLMAALAFQHRWESLFKHVLMSKKPLGNIKDYFIRVEFQARGSPHLHLFIWSETGFDMDKATAEQLVKVIDKSISTTIPDVSVDKELHDLVTRFQLHKHSFTCQKGTRTCRFHFPKRICRQTRICYSTDMIANHRGQFYETRRSADDVWINAYNPEILRHWRANMDIQLVGNAESCAFYVCKYICKAEPEELKEALGCLFSDANFQTLDKRKRLIKIGVCLLKKRKISAQEAVYRLGGLKLTNSSRLVVSINTLPSYKKHKLIKPSGERQHLPDNCTDEHLLFEPSNLDYYRHRPLCLEDISLFTFLSRYKKHSGPMPKNPRYPRLQLLRPFEDIYFYERQHFVIVNPTRVRQCTDDYYYSCLLLYFPHRHDSELLIPCPDYKTAFLLHYNSFDSEYSKYKAFQLDLENAIRRVRLVLNEGNCTEPDSRSNNDTSQGHEYGVMDCSDQSTLSEDVTNDQTSIDVQQSEDFSWHVLATSSISESSLERDLQMLSSDQKKVFRFIENHFKMGTSTPLRMFCSGGGGTGKSFLLKVIVEWLRLCYPVASGFDPVIVSAPTGIAARNVNGYTIHSVFKLPVQHGYEPEFHELSPPTLKHLQTTFRTVHTIIIDEISMISSTYLNYIHNRLCCISNNPEPFGNFNVIIFGDFFQLRPVRGKFAFTDQILWPLFEPFILNVNQRQSNNNSFAHLLSRVRYGHVSENNQTMLLQRLLKYHPNVDTSNILHIFPTNKQVKKYNSIMQGKLTSRVHNFPADHVFAHYDVNPGHQVPENLVPEDDRFAGGLPRHLEISIGTRVMLLRNLATREGLVNGAMGFVTDIISTCENSQIFVKFNDSSIGLTYQVVDHDNSIPITVYTQEYLYSGRYINRIQFPLSPAWACTVHKVQGLTVDSAVISLGPEIFQAGQAYVALSRVRTLDGLYLNGLCFQRIYSNSDVLSMYESVQDHIRQRDLL